MAGKTTAHPRVVRRIAADRSGHRCRGRADPSDDRRPPAGFTLPPRAGRRCATSGAWGVRVARNPRSPARPLAQRPPTLRGVGQPPARPWRVSAVQPTNAYVSALHRPLIPSLITAHWPPTPPRFPIALRPETRHHVRLTPVPCRTPKGVPPWRNPSASCRAWTWRRAAS